jgi:hypothetical protein
MEGIYLWEWFVDLHGARTSSGFGINPIPYAEIHAWASLSQLSLSVWEVRVLRQMDRAWLSAFVESQKKPSS